jgi:hypothetical protein
LDNIFFAGQVNWPNLILVDQSLATLANFVDISNSYQDIYVGSFSNSGTFRFWRKIQGSGDDYFHDLKIGPDNSVFVAFSRRTNNTTLKTENNTLLATFPAQVTTNEGFLLKLTNAGAYAWHYWLSDAATYNFIGKIFFDVSGNIDTRFSPGGTIQLRNAANSTVATLNGETTNPTTERDTCFIKINSDGSFGYMNLITFTATSPIGVIDVHSSGKLMTYFVGHNGLKIKSAASGILKTFAAVDEGAMKFIEFDATGAIANEYTFPSTAAVVTTDAYYVGNAFKFAVNAVNQTSMQASSLNGNSIVSNFSANNTYLYYSFSPTGTITQEHQVELSIVDSVFYANAANSNPWIWLFTSLSSYVVDGFSVMGTSGPFLNLHSFN